MINQWIDENDLIYQSLRIWMEDAEGKVGTVITLTLINLIVFQRPYAEKNDIFLYFLFPLAS